MAEMYSESREARGAARGEGARRDEGAGRGEATASAASSSPRMGLALSPCANAHPLFRPVVAQSCLEILVPALARSTRPAGT